MRELTMRDRIGLGWRPELAAGILANLDRIDVVEIVADDYLEASARELRSLRTLAAQAPLTLHGLSLGMASTAPVDRRRLDRMARLVDRLRPESWSEHLAFVRAGAIEIGHLAAPPRTASTVEATAANLDAARAVVGRAPLMENIATLIDPPASDLDEPDWLCRTVEASGFVSQVIAFGSRPAAAACPRATASFSAIASGRPPTPPGV